MKMILNVKRRDTSYSALLFLRDQTLCQAFLCPLHLDTESHIGHIIFVVLGRHDFPLLFMQILCQKVRV